tara:strand:- start:99 stop:719 length:621 start_codon:yes stop_codon:yes gene_type:complete
LRKFKKYGLIFTFVFFALELYPQLEAKANVLTSLGLIPNVGIELQVGEKNSLQLDVLASFWNKLNNTKTPLHINQTFLEYRFYKKNDLSGLFIGPHIGYGMFTLKKPNFAIIYDPYAGGSYDNDSYQSGRVAFYGFTIGYKKRLSQRISLEAFIGGGYSMANYKAFRVDIRIDNRDNWRTFNRSGEFVAYRGGLMINYNFNPYKNK